MRPRRRTLHLRRGTEECSGDCVAVEQFQTDVDNCGSCRTRCRRAPECQLPACIDGACGSVPDESQIGQPCGHSGGVCGTDGNCACPPEQSTACRSGCIDMSTDLNNCGTCDNRCPNAHGEAVCTGGVCGICDDGYNLCGDGCCADGRDCCNGDCCGPNQCCTPEGCERCRCVIGIESFDAGEVNPDNACQFCDPTRNRNDWTLHRRRLLRRRSDLLQRRVLLADRVLRRRSMHGRQLPRPVRNPGPAVRADDRNPANDCQVCEPDEQPVRLDARRRSGRLRRCVRAGLLQRRMLLADRSVAVTSSCEECGPHCRIGDEDIPTKIPTTPPIRARSANPRSTSPTGRARTTIPSAARVGSAAPASAVRSVNAATTAPAESAGV